MIRKIWNFLWNGVDPYDAIGVSLLAAALIGTFVPAAYHFVVVLALLVVSSFFVSRTLFPPANNKVDNED